MHSESKSELSFVLDSYLSMVEKWFFDIRNPRYEHLLEKIDDDNPNKALSVAIRAGDYGGIRDFIVSFEKILFQNYELERLDSSATVLIESYIERYKAKLSFLNQLIDAYASGFYENKTQASFYKQLISSLEKILSKSHPAFTDKEAYLAKAPIVSLTKIPENTIFNKALNGVIKPHILKSPDKVVAAFEILVENGYCDIHNVPAFVYQAFIFPAQYKVPNNPSYTSFRWNKPYHALTVMIRDLKKKRTITNTHADLIGWLKTLLPQVSQDSIRKYISSNDKEVSEKNRIDIQIFN